MCWPKPWARTELLAELWTKLLKNCCSPLESLSLLLSPPSAGLLGDPTVWT